MGISLPESHDEAAERHDASGRARAAEHEGRASKRLASDVAAALSPLLLDVMGGKRALPETTTKPWQNPIVAGCVMLALTNLVGPLLSNLRDSGQYGDKITALTTNVAALAGKVDQIADRYGQSASTLNGQVQTMQFQIQALQKSEDQEHSTIDALTRTLNEGAKNDAEQRAKIEALDTRTQNMMAALRMLQQDAILPNRPRQYPDAQPQRDKDSQTGSWPGGPAQDAPFAEAER